MSRVLVKCTRCPWSAKREVDVCCVALCPKCSGEVDRVRAPELPPLHAKPKDRARLARVSTLCSWLRVAVIGAQMRRSS